MFEEVEEFLNALSSEFVAGDIDALLTRLSCPAARYFGEDLILIRDRAALESLTVTYLEGLRMMGLAKSSTRLDSLETASDGRLVASTTSVFTDACGRPAGIGRATYYLRKTEEGIKLEMSQHSPTQIGEEDVNAALSTLKV